MKRQWSRREFITAALAGLALGPQVLAQTQWIDPRTGRPVSNSQKLRKLPNIVLIYADDLGYGDVSCYGATGVKTPSIDRLANEGIRFTSGYASAATCTPSRYAMLTGEYAWRQAGKGIAPGDAPLLIEPGRTTMASILKRTGYRTGVVGKWHLGLGKGDLDWNGKIAPGPRELGFDYSFLIPATNDRVPCVYVENGSVVGLDPNDPIEVRYNKPVGTEPTGRDNPELLRIHPSHGHDNTIINGISRIGYMSGGHAARWRDEDIADVLSEKAVHYLEKHKEERFFLYYAMHDPHMPRVPHDRFVGKTTMGARGDVIVQIDWCVKQITDTLDRLGLTENTLVIFSSDNGPVLDDGYQDRAVELVGDHKPAGPFRGGKYSRFEAGTRVPFIARWPQRIKPGQVSDAILCHVDFPATLAALTGQRLRTDDAPDSFDIAAALFNGAESGRDHLVQEGIQGALGFRQGDWKYHEPNQKPDRAWAKDIELGNSPRPQLYHLKEDPGETKNLAEQYPEKVEQMHARLQEIKKAGRSRI
jgi:arylsulfatase A-like enzyme